MDTKTNFDTNESTEEEDEGYNYNVANMKRVVFTGGSRREGGSGGGSECGSSDGRVTTMVRCQAQGCEVDLNDGKRYHRRHKVCEVHAKFEAVIVAGLIQRFCQQCSRFHELSEFDCTKRSCRSRLAGHNERRRKSPAEFPGEGSSTHQRSRLVITNKN